jgi:hypothetical protein
MKSESVPNPGIQNRRSSRVPLVIPISIAGVHPDTGVRFEAFGETLVVNRQRCLNQHDFCANGRHAPMDNRGNQRQISLGEGRLGYRSKRRPIRNRIGRS